MSNDVLNKIKALIICLGILLVLIVLQISLLNVFAEGCRSLFRIDFRLEPVLVALFHIIYSVMGSFIFWFFYERFRRVVDDRSPVRGGRGYLVITGIAMQAVTYGLLNIVYLLMPPNDVLDSYSKTISKLNGSNTALIFVYTMLLAPILEEYVFRGVIMETARNAFSPNMANFIQAVLFGLYHGNIIQGIYAFLLGSAFGHIKNKRRRITSTILVHISVNVSGIFIVPVMAYCLTGIFSMLLTYLIIVAFGVTLLVEFLPKACYNNHNCGNKESEWINENQP